MASTVEYYQLGLYIELASSSKQFCETENKMVENLYTIMAKNIRYTDQGQPNNYC